MAKYNNIKTNGYDSKKEANRAFELECLEKLGEISELKKQVRFELLPTQYEHQITMSDGFTYGNTDKKKRGNLVEKKCSYIADFTYIQDGKYIVEDCKGMRTEAYKIKKKLMLFTHGIKIKET